MSRRPLGYIFLGFCLLAAAFALAGWRVPFFKIPFLASPVIGWIVLGAGAIWGARMAFTGPTMMALNPLTRRKITRFRSIRRGHWSFILLLGLMGIAASDNLLVGKRPLLIYYKGALSCPFAMPPQPATKFGGSGQSETDYRALEKQFQRDGRGDWMIMPPIPYEPKQDAETLIQSLSIQNRLVVEAKTNHAFSGIAYTSFEDNPGQRRSEWRFVQGLRHGDFRTWNASGEQIANGRFQKGQPEAGTPAATDEGTLQHVVFPPLPPSFKPRHLMGTDSGGNDVLAQLFGGLQMSIMASLLFLVFTFTIGIIVGSAMGYFGGWVDLTGQRLIEIWGNVPFLLAVMILSTLVRPDLLVLVSIIAIFSWMNTAAFLRTATFRERERDYVAAARLLGAGGGRVVFRHILPNVIATIVTLFPFKVAAIITSLAALDFLGFGLPPEAPSWGRLLHEGTENMNAPWIVSAAFLAIVGVLILVTFVGEAVREAFDPKKFTTYQ